MINIKMKKLQEVEKRIKKLPEFYNDMMLAKTKRQAQEFVKKYQKHIKDNDFGFKPLIDPTIENKKKAGYRKPETPLYGKGKDEDKSYYNMFLLKELKNGYKVVARWAKHHLSKLKLRDLLTIHEYGATITVTDKMRMALHAKGIHLRKSTGLIRIPPRPYAHYTYREILQGMKKKEGSREVKRAINAYIVKGQDELMNKIKEREKANK